MTGERVRNGDRAAGEKGVVQKGEVKEERERVLLRAAYVESSRFAVPGPFNEIC
jgi:hypothetical protein